MDVDAWVRSFLQEMDAIHGISSNLKDNLQNLIKGFLMSFCFIPYYIREMSPDGTTKVIFLQLYAVARIQTHVSRVVPTRDL